MEKELRLWLRYCMLFGVYIGTNRKSENKLKLFVGSEESRAPRNSTVWPSRTKRFTFPCSNQKAYIYLLLCVLCVIYIHGLYWRNIIPGLMLTWIASTMIFTSQVGTNFVIIYEAWHKQREHEKFLTLLDEIEVYLKLRLRLDVQQVALLKFFRLHLLWHLFIALSTLLLYVITSIWLNYTGFFWHGLWSILTLRIRTIQVVGYVRILRHYLECLCVKLRQIEAYRRAPHRRMLDVNYEKLESLECLLAVKETYALLHKAFELMNNFVGWSLFCIITSYLFDTGTNLYWTLLSFDGYVRRRYYNIAGVAVIAPLIIIIVHLCYLCYKCKELGHTIANLLSRIRIASSEHSLASYRLVLYHFSAQLQLQCIEVTAQNFFVLEMRLLMTILTAIAMNLVILIQFLMS